MRVAVVGAGIAGTTLAYWLRRSGHVPTLIEKAPHLRTGGYLIDFWGVGYRVAELMDLRDQVQAEGYAVDELRLVDRRGKRVGGFGVEALRRSLDGRYTSLRRGDLAQLIYDALNGEVETIFDDTVVDVAESADAVRVVLRSGVTREFDLVVGAGGLHSPVRERVFGADSAYAKDLGYCVAAFTSTGYRPRDELVYFAHGMPGRMVSRFSMRGDATTFLLIFTSDQFRGPLPRQTDEVKGVLHEVFRDDGWECPEILRTLDKVDDIYSDSVSQIVMPHWSRGRVALIGDAAGAVSLLAGEGTALAMAQAYVLAGELNRADADFRLAFDRYEKLLRPLVEQKQAAARRFAAAFAPKTAAGVWIRNTVTRLFAVPHIGDRLLSRQLRDTIVLPAYGI